MDSDIKKYLKILFPITIAVIALIGFYLVFYHIYPFVKNVGGLFFSALSPFILAVVLAILVDPIVAFFEKKIKMSRSLAVIISLTLIFGIIILLLVMVSSRLIIELIELSNTLSGLSNQIIDLGWQTIKDIRTFISTNPLPVDVEKSIESNISDVFSSLKDFLSVSTEKLIGFLATLPIMLTMAVVSFIATYFISKDKETIYNFLINLVPVKWVLPINKVFGTMTDALFGFLRAQFILITITGIQTVIGLYFLGVEYAFTIGLVTGILDLIPILGPGTVFLPWIIWNLIMGKYKFAMALSILYGFLLIVRQLIEPKILSKNIGLHPLATLVAVFMGLRLFGVSGLFIGPIILLLIKTFLQIKNKGDI